MKKQKVILATILLLCLIVGIIVGKSKNINKETVTIKQMNESTQVSDLNKEIDQLNASHTEYANYVQTCKEKIAAAITNEGVDTSNDSTFDIIAENIGKIVDSKTVATATAAQILNGQTAWVNGNKIIGTMENRGTLDWNPSDSTSYELLAGYYEGGTISTSNAYTEGYNNGYNGAISDIKKIDTITVNINSTWGRWKFRSNIKD